MKNPTGDSLWGFRSAIEEIRGFEPLKSLLEILAFSRVAIVITDGQKQIALKKVCPLVPVINGQIFCEFRHFCPNIGIMSGGSGDISGWIHILPRAV